MSNLVKIVLPNYPVKIAMSKGRRKKYFTKDDRLPKKYQSKQYEFKVKLGVSRLYDTVEKSYVVKNEKFIDIPRYQSLSYNKISTRLKIPVLIKLKEWMADYMPRSLNMDGPLRVTAHVYDWAVPMHKDLDNMHIYYKAFLDLMKQRGMIKDDSKRYITEAGGFIFIPITDKDNRRLEFHIQQDTREIIKTSLMYNLLPKTVIRGKSTGVGLVESATEEPGKLLVQTTQMTGLSHMLLMNFGKTKIIKANADKLFRAVYEHCLNYSTCCTVNKEFYRIHSDRIRRFLLDMGIQVIIKV